MTTFAFGAVSPRPLACEGAMASSPIRLHAADIKARRLIR